MCCTKSACGRFFYCLEVAMGNIHQCFEAKMPEKVHEYCAQHMKSLFSAGIPAKRHSRFHTSALHLYTENG
jgi:hypothetical protein